MPAATCAAARAGRLSGFTGVDAPYDRPAAPDLVIATDTASVGAAAEQLAAFAKTLVAPPGLELRVAGAD